MGVAKPNGNLFQRDKAVILWQLDYLQLGEFPEDGVVAYFATTQLEKTVRRRDVK